MSRVLPPALNRILPPLLVGLLLPLLLLGFLSTLSTPVAAAPAPPLAVASEGSFAALPHEPVNPARQLGAPLANNCYILANSMVYTQSLQAAIDASASGGTIRISGTCDTLVTHAGSTQLGYITKSLTLIGGYSSSFTEPPLPSVYPSILDAGNGGRVLYISGNVTVNVQNLTLQNGRVGSGSGGALYATGSPIVTLSDSTLSDNSAANGGALYQSGGELTLSGLTASDNSATGNGGALYLNGSSATLSDLSLTNNSASGNGGGLYASSTSLTLNDGTLSGHSAASGGVFYLSGGDATLGPLTASGNSASSTGGVLYASNNSLNLANSTLSTNTAGSGGALYLNGGSATLSDLTLSSNSATSGGALYSNGSSLSFSTLVASLNSASSGAGGALYLSGGSATINGATFTSNSATGDGGALYASNSPLSLDSGTLSANESSGGAGGALYLSGGSLTLSGSTLSGNQADSHGGALYAATPAVTISNSSLLSNLSNSGQGGAGYLSGASGTISASTWDQNEASSHGGGLVALDSTLTFSSNTLSSNKSNLGLGGALYLSGGEATLTGSSLTSNSAYTHGGAIYMTATLLSLTDGSVASNKSSVGHGGAIYGYEGSLSATGVPFSSNEARGGGAIYLYQSESTLSGTTFSSNKSHYGEGGALFLNEGTASLSGSVIEKNSSYKGGGGGAYISGTTISLLDNTIQENSTSFNTYTVQVGEITETKVITYTDPDTYIYPGPVIETHVISDNGGGFYLKGATAYFTNSYFLKNEATANGGALYLDGSKVTMWNTLVAQNNIYVGDYVTDTTFMFGGSGIYVTGSEATFIHSTIADNTNIHGSSPLNNTTAIYVAKTGAQKSSKLTLKNNILANHYIGLYADEGTPQAVGESNVWGNNTERDWSRDLFDDFSTHYLGDPGFVDAAAGDYRISASSPAFGVGVEIQELSSDIEGTPRVRGFAADAGAYEQQYTHGLYLDQSSSEPIVADGMALTYTIRIANHSSAPVSDVTFENTLPANHVLVGLSSNGSALPCTTNPCTLGSIAPEQEVEILLEARIVGKPPAGQVVKLLNRASVASPDLTAGNSDLTNELAVYHQDIVLSSAADQPMQQDQPMGINAELALAGFTGACRIHLNGKDYASLQSALNASNQDTDIIKVSGNCAISSTTIKYKVTIQGGWNSDLSELNPTLYPTSLQAVGGRHFVITDGEPTLENLKLSGGSAPSGGSILYTGGGGKLINLHITGNSATSKGGGLYLSGGAVPSIENSLVESNSASSGGAGAYLVDSGATIRDTIFRSNSGASDGGGIYLKKSGAQILGVTVENHSASGDGGGLFLDESPAQIVGGTIQNNRAGRGGGIFADKSAATVSNNLIQGNTATKSSSILHLFYVFTKSGGGGGIFADESAVRILQNRIEGNSAPGNDGGGITLWNAPMSAQIDGNVIAGNSGGGIVVRQLAPIFKFYIILPPLLLPDLSKNPLTPLDLPASPIQIRHNTLVRNQGDGLWVVGRTNVTLLNNIIANNSGKGVQLTTESIPHLYFLIIPLPFGLLPLLVPVPTFYAPKAVVDNTLWGPGGASTAASESVWSELEIKNDVSQHGAILAFKPDGYHIKRISAAYNAGANPDIALDIDREPRIQGGVVDVGADEYSYVDTLYVTPSGNDSEADIRKRCRNWQSPCSLQQALEAASEGSLIKVAGGTYSQVYSKEGQQQVAFVNKTLTIQGGYYPAVSSQYNDPLGGSANKQDWEYPYPDENPSIFNAGGAGRALYITGAADKVKPNIYGVHLTGGSAGQGGGAYVLSATATFSDVQVYGNSAQSGAGLYLNDSPSVLQASTIRNNSAANNGGGLYLQASAATISENRLESNSAAQGGGIYLTTGKAQVQSNTLSANSATLGGAFYLSGSDAATLQGNQVVGNSASEQGGGLYALASAAKLNENRFESNQAKEGGGLYIKEGEDQLTLNVVVQNQASMLGGGYYLNAAGTLVTSDTVQSNAAVNGGGFYMADAQPAGIKGVTLANNLASGDGGAAYLRSSAATFENSILTGNQAQSGSGGALHLASFSSAQVKGSTLDNNTAQLDGGAVHVKFSEVTIESSKLLTNSARTGGGLYMKLSGGKVTLSTLSNNTASTFGGAVYLDESATELSANKVNNNRAHDGGGYYILRSNSAKVSTSFIHDNEASNDGGGVFLWVSSIQVQENTIHDNQAAARGGGLFAESSTLEFGESALFDNQAAQGGGAYLTNGLNGKLTNLALVRNQASSRGSGLLLAGYAADLMHMTFNENGGGDGSGLLVTDDGIKGSAITLRNSIVVNHAVGVSVTQNSTVTMDVTFWGAQDDVNVVEWAGAGTIVTGTTHVRGLPRFAADGYHLLADSAAIDEAIAPSLPKDMDGEQRPNGNAPDIGADEYVPRTCFVHLSSMPEMSYTNVQSAVDAANEGDTIKIAGQCLGVQERGGLRQAIYLNKSLTIQGGYSPTNWITAYPLTQTSTINAGGLGRVLYITGDITPLIENLHLSGGSANSLGGGPLAADAGGAIYVDGSRPLFRDNRIANSLATYGGGVYLKASPATFEGNTFQANSAVAHGGGIYLDASNALIEGNTFEQNKGSNGGALYLGSSNAAQVRGNTLLQNNADYGAGLFLDNSLSLVEGNTIEGNKARSGGGIYLDLSAAQVLSNTLRSNQATLENGGGLYLGYSSATLEYNQLYSNTAANVGGGLYLNNSGATINRSTIMSNSASSGGGLYLDFSVDSTLHNNVIAHNSGTVKGGGVYLVASSATLVHNTIVGNLGGDKSALYLSGGGGAHSQATLVNNIIANHDNAIVAAAGSTVDSSATLWSNNVNKLLGAGTLTTSSPDVVGQPLFVNAAQRDYHILKASAALDTGISSAVTQDLDGQPRPGGSKPDVGADEYYQPELKAFVSGTPEPVLSGNQLTYLYRVNNTGNLDLHGTVTASVPATLSSMGVMTWNNVTIPQGQSWTAQLQLPVPASYAGPLPTTMRVQTLEGVQATARYTATAEVPQAGVSAAIAAPAGAVNAGNTIRYTLYVRNTGNVDLEVRITNTLPAQVTLLSTEASPTQVWTRNITPKGSWIYWYDVRVNSDATGYLTNTLQVTSNRGVQDQTTTSNQVAHPGLQLHSVPSGDPVTAGQPITYTLYVTNTGNVTLNATISDILPEQVTPNQLKQWVTTIEPNTSWSEQVTSTVKAGYVGPLTNTLTVVTKEGGQATHTTLIQTRLPRPGPTIQSAKNGAWEEPASWNPARVPNSSDIVLVNEGHTIDSECAFIVQGLENHGTIRCNAQTGAVTVTETLYNMGFILGRDGTDESESTPAEAGGTISVHTALISNTGTIRAGDGGQGLAGGGSGGNVLLLLPDGALLNDESGRIVAGNGGEEGGAGGAIEIEASNATLVNDGLIQAGNGGDTQTGAATVAAGGPVLIKGEKSQVTNGATGTIKAGDGGAGADGGAPGGAATVLSQDLLNEGKIAGGDGGAATSSGTGGDGGDANLVAGHSSAGSAEIPGEVRGGAGGSPGGDGGDILVVANPIIQADKGTLVTGKAATGGTDGALTLTAGNDGTLSLTGADTTLQGSEITLAVGDNATLNLGNMRQGAITASGNVTLAVGSGGQLNLLGAGAPLVQGDGTLLVASSNVTLPEEQSLQQMMGGAVTATGSRLLRSATLITPKVVPGQAGEAVRINVILLNSGTAPDSFGLTRRDAEGWTLGSLVASVNLAGGRVRALSLVVQIPATAQVGDSDLVTIFTASKTDPIVQAQVQPLVFVDRANSTNDTGTTLYLPIMRR